MKSALVDASGTIQLDDTQWFELLHDKKIISENLLQMLFFILDQKNQESTATELAEHFRVPHQAVTLWYVNASKKIYDKFGITPPPNDDGGKRYWTVCFMNKTDHEKDEHDHWYLQLRPSLAKALQKDRA